MDAICIWERKYKDDTVLVSCLRVDKDNNNQLFFCLDKDYPNVYEFDIEKVKKEAEITTNGSIYCYKIPISWLKEVRKLNNREIKLKEKEISKYKRKIFN